MTEQETQQTTEPTSPIETSRYITALMDMSIPVPGTGFKLGLDGILGLFPVIGDLVTGLAGGWIIFDAIKHKAPPETVGKMAVNLGLDVVGGAAVPVAGDLFDVVWKANRKNLTLLEEHLGLPITYNAAEKIDGEERFRPKAKVRPVLNAESNANGGSQMPDQTRPGQSQTYAVASGWSDHKLDLVRYDFVASRVVRRSETEVRSSGGDGMITGYNGNVYGSVNPVTISSRTRHVNEVWFTRDDGTETYVLIDADAVPIREGQNLRLVFAVGRALGKDMPLLVVHNQSMRKTSLYAGFQRAAMVAGQSLNPYNWMTAARLPLRPLMWVFAAGVFICLIFFRDAFDDNRLRDTLPLFMLPAGIAGIVAPLALMGLRARRFVKEAAAFASDDSLSAR